MAFGTAFAPINLDIFEIMDGTVVEQTASVIRVEHGTRITVFEGAFTYSIFGEVFGTLDKMTGFENSVKIYELTDIDADANAVFNAIEVEENPELAASIVLAKDDDLTGSSGADEMLGFAQNDTIRGQGGNDTIDGGTGNDSILGGDDDDFLRGGTQEDRLFGESGNDTLFGDAGFDWLEGGIGNDLLDGGAQADNLFGGAGVDTLLGGGGFDRLFGGDDNDLAYGGDGPDALLGQLGNDSLYAQAGNDRMFGGVGNDLLDGGAGDDAMSGGAGFDTLVGSTGNDQLTGAYNADTFVFADFGGGFGQDTINDFAADNPFEKIDLRLVASITDFADLTNPGSPHMSQVGAHVVIDDFGGNTITLLNVNIGDLDSSDFIF